MRRRDFIAAQPKRLRGRCSDGRSQQLTNENRVFGAQLTINLKSVFAEIPSWVALSRSAARFES
jgi:hypothetical protein